MHFETTHGLNSFQMVTSFNLCIRTVRDISDSPLGQMHLFWPVHQAVNNCVTLTSGLLQCEAFLRSSRNPKRSQAASGWREPCSSSSHRASRCSKAQHIVFRVCCRIKVMECTLFLAFCHLGGWKPCSCGQTTFLQRNTRNTQTLTSWCMSSCWWRRRR